ncbi:hypothetical protein [Streptomyces sp. JJ36]|uniref:hypothetical protein n=1 Tax=Streptomyces sp. JJ36 TaxID=2736645 RepID=UPI001F484263|nr:hypothetical protein [Streptomyces sp. JJ36]MCF6522437.1 hypothetical protein [Streptomyces sp. JJ36]
MFLAQHVTAVERLLGGPTPRCAALRTGAPFWDDDGTARAEAEEAFTTDCEALVALLSRRWGEPEELDLTGCLERLAEGAAVPEPWRTLCPEVRLLHRWRLDGRWLGLGVGRPGEVLPLRLLAAVGDDAG